MAAAICSHVNSAQLLSLISLVDSFASVKEALKIISAIAGTNHRLGGARNTNNLPDFMRKTYVSISRYRYPPSYCQIAIAQHKLPYYQLSKLISKFNLYFLSVMEIIMYNI